MPGEGPLVEAINVELERFPSIAFAVLFGSAALDRLRADSDVDLAIYDDVRGLLEIETNHPVSYEVDLQVSVERATNRNVDLLILNRAPATVCASALLTGHPVLIRDRSLYSRYYLAVTNVAMDFIQTERELREIRQRSRSVSELDRSRLERILDVIAEEAQDAPRFREVSLEQYLNSRDVRRDLLAHEYLDIRFRRIGEFVTEGVEAVRELAETARTWLGA